MAPIKLKSDKAATSMPPVFRKADFSPFLNEQVNQSLPSRFEKQVRNYPDRLAINTAARSVTYRELNILANRIAQAILPSRNPAEPVALMSGSDIESIAGILGVLKAGRILVPLDLERPVGFNEQVLKHADVRLILAAKAQMSAALELAPQGVQTFNIEELQSGVAHDNLGLTISPHAICWILYTSGSTGVPKGVMQTHRDELHNVMTITNSHFFSPADRMTLLRRPSVGGAIRNLFSALLNGASLFPYQMKEIGVAALAECMLRDNITVYHSSASLFRSFANQLSVSCPLPEVRVVRLGSEAVMWSDVELFKSHFSPPCVLVNALSSTEARTYLQYFVDARTEIKSGVLPAGYPVDDTEVSVLDENGRPVSPGDVGEFVLRSAYIFPGYWKSTSKLRNTVTSEPGAPRVLHTGDIGRQLADGSFEYAGRKDLLCKVRGHPVQISFVETEIQASPEVERAVVVPHPWRGENRLVAYILTRNQQQLDRAKLRTFLQQRLSEFMIPAVFVCLDEMPTTPSGKVDRGALPPPDNERPNTARNLIPARNEVERVLAELWAKTLGVSEIGVTDNFVELGGHSLLAAELVGRIEQVFAVQITPQTLLESMTIADLAGLLISQMPNRSAEQIARLWTGLDHLEPGQIHDALMHERTTPGNVR